jgi:NTP pyrophosphatase (non-canonical NTP hydrolase)
MQMNLNNLELERKTRETLATLLEQCGELADGVRYFEGDDLEDLLDTLDYLRAHLADNSATLRAAISEGGLRHDR